ncbi:MAG TPA: YncE family protein [Solirubrobacterales bacterium]
MRAAVPRMRLTGFLAMTAAALAFALAAPPDGRSADRIYWTSFDSGTVQWANLDGSGGVHEVNPGAATISPMGYGLGNAIDPAQERVYWANQQQGKIDWANLDGSGGGDLDTGAATVNGPSGLSFDPRGRRVFWSNESGQISYARVDGSGGGDLSTTGATATKPFGATVDPATNRVYWTNFELVGSISYASLDGGGGGNLSVTGAAPLQYPFGLAIDDAARRIYWANDTAPGAISAADLDGANSVEVDRRGLEMQGTYGVAVDPEAGRVYTALFAGNELAFLNTNGTGGATLPFGLPKESGPNYPTIYRQPEATGAPTLSAKPPLTPRPKRRRGPAPLPKLIGSRLSCSGGSFAPDLIEAHLYRAPVTIVDVLTGDGEPVRSFGVIDHGLAAPPPAEEFTADAVGDYRCQSVGANIAGSAGRTSPPVAIFKTGKLRRNLRKGSAKLAVELPAEPGTLKLATKGLRAVSRTASGDTAVVLRPTGARKRKLARTGKLKAIARLTYTPPGGAPATLRTRVTLRSR